MKRLIISTILILIILSGCEQDKETQHNAVIYIQCLDAKSEANPLSAIEVYYQERMFANLTNLPSPYCDTFVGVCDDLNLFVDGVENNLVIEWLNSQPEERKTLRNVYTLPFRKMDSVLSGTSVLDPEEKAILLYMNMDEQEFQDYIVNDTILWR